MAEIADVRRHFTANVARRSPERAARVLTSLAHALSSSTPTGAKILESRFAPCGLGWRAALLQGWREGAKITARRAALGALREDGILVHVLSNTPCSVNRICGAIWSPIFCCPAVAARCIGDAVRSSDPACSGPTWAASADILVQASLARDDWQLIEITAAGHGSCERSSGEKG